MTESQTPATQAELDAMTYRMYVDVGTKAATAREMGVNESTVRDRIKRHLARETGARVAAREALAEEIAKDTPDGADEPDMPAGIDPEDYLAYRVDCDKEQGGCGAVRFRPCFNKNRDDVDVLMPYAHPVRIKLAKDAGLSVTPVEGTQVAGNVVVINPVSLQEFVDQVGAEATAHAARVQAGQPVEPEVGMHDRSGDPDYSERAAEDKPAHVCTGDECKVDRCVRCGTPFGHFITQHRCGSPKMCDRRVELGDPYFGRRGLSRTA